MPYAARTFLPFPCGKERRSDARDVNELYWDLRQIPFASPQINADPCLRQTADADG